MAAHVSKAYDVIIIGGGITGLYTAWRLASNTKLKVLVLEATNRLGGRLMSREMPGGFVAEMGAMRYVPTCQPLIDTVIKHLGVKTQPHVQLDDSKNKFKFSLRNKQVNSLAEFCELLSISEEDLPYFQAVSWSYFPSIAQGFDFIPSENGNFETAVFPPTGQLAKDVSLCQYLLQTNNVELLNASPMFYASIKFPMSVVDAEFQLLANHWSSVRVIDEGFEAVARSLAAKLAGFPNVEIRCGEKVGSIAQNGAEFYVKLADGDKGNYLCQKIVYACSAVGLDNIMLEEQPRRQAILKEMRSKVTVSTSFKLFLTYARPWWEDYGIFEGSIATDLPSGECIAFGEKGKCGSFATLLAAYSHNHFELFQSLDLDSHERFINTTGNVSSELIPSKLLVNHVHNSLKQIMGCPDLVEEPVCAMRIFWGTGDYAGAYCYPKCGVNSNQLHWDSHKPFDDADLYISGDIFTTWEPSGTSVGFVEQCLLTSERILTNHFGLKPFTDGLCLKNAWPMHCE